MAGRLRRQDTSRPFGGTWYRCSSDFGGFSGCCTMDPCYHGGGCPKEKDTTPGRNTPTATKPATATTSSSRVSEASFIKLPTPTTMSPQPTTTSALRTGTAGATLPTAYVTLDRVPSATSSHTPDPIPNSLPVVAIVGIAVGGAVLVGLGVLLLICRRRRKQKNIYQAPIYVSPFNTSSDMSHKGDSIYKANLSGPSFNTRDLKKQDCGTHCGATASSPRLVELPGESGMGSH